MKRKRKFKVLWWFVLAVVGLLIYPVSQTLVQETKMRSLEAALSDLAAKLQTSTTPDEDTLEFARLHDTSHHIIRGEKAHRTRTMMGLSFNVLLPFPHLEVVAASYTFDEGHLTEWESARTTTYL